MRKIKKKVKDYKQGEKYKTRQMYSPHFGWIRVERRKGRKKSYRYNKN